MNEIANHKWLFIKNKTLVPLWLSGKKLNCL